MVEQLIRDQNHVPVAGGVSSASATTVLPFKIDSVTGRLLVDNSGGGSGTVTDVSVVTANGFAGSVADSTTTPAITLSTTVNSPVLAGNGTAISAATTTGSGSTVVLATAPTFPTNITVGAAAGATGDILLKGTTSGTVTLTVADAAGTWTLQLPADDGNSGQVLTTNGSGVTTWETPAGGGNVSNTGTPLDNQIAIWTNATTIEGVAGLTYDGTTLATTGAITGASSLTLGAAAGATGDLVLTGLTSGAVTVTVADAAGTWTLQLPANDGDSGQVLTTNGSGVTTWETPATGTVTSVSGTADRITSSGGATPVIDIAATYVGQTSITTLGTVTTGTLSTGAVIAGVTMTLGSDATGDIYYRNAGGVLTRLGVGSNTNVLTLAGGLPSWAAPAAAGTITVANEATDTTCFPIFVTAATGDLAPKSNTGLTFNSNTALLTATLLAGTTSVTSATIRASSNDSGSLGASGTAFSDLFLASGAVIDFAAGNSVITHSSAVLTVSTGDLRVTTAGTNSASVVTVGGTQTLTAKTLSSAIYTGAQTFSEGAFVELDVALSADGTYTGTAIAGTAGAALAFGDVVYFAVADSRWELADASAASTGGSVWIGICVLAAAGDGSATRVLLSGTVRADTAFPALTVGAPVYLSETAGDVVTTAPTTTDSVTRVLGYGIDSNSMAWNPSNDWITHT